MTATNYVSIDLWKLNGYTKAGRLPDCSEKPTATA
jgi:hypothetical protein